MPEPKVGRDFIRTFRIPRDEWEAAQEVARERQESLSKVIRDALRRYVARHTSKKGA